MKRITEIYLKKFKKVILLQIVLCAVSAIVISCFSRKEREVNFGKDNLAGGIITEEGTACIDENDEVYGIVLDVTTDEIKRGWYKVRIEYETGYDDNGFIVQALKPGDVLNEDIGNEERTVSLKSYHNSQEVHAWLKKDSELRIAVHFCGGGYLQVKRILLRQVPDYTPVFLLMICLLFINIELYDVGHFSAVEVKQRRLIRGGIACIVLLGSIPLINDFNIHGHDYRFHLYRMEGIAEGLLSGQFPVKIMPNWWNEFGDGAPMFYGDAMLYVPAVILLLGYSLQTAYKCYIVLINLLTAWIAYHCSFKISKDYKIALVGAFLYSLNFYRLIDIYVRCALGEYTALVFLPLIIVGIYFIKKEGWFYLVLGLTGCIQSHILTCEMVIIFLILFCLVKCRWIFSKQVFLSFCKAGIVTFLWNVWFIVPFLNTYMGGNYKIQSYEVPWDLEDRGVSIISVFKVFFNGSVENNYTIGLALILCGILAFVLVLISRRKIVSKEDKEQNTFACNCLFFMFIAIVLSTKLVPYSKICDISVAAKKIIKTIQFPFRFMALASVLAVMAFMGAYSLWERHRSECETKRNRILGNGMLVMLVTLTVAGIWISYEKLFTDSIKTKNYEYYATGYVMEAMDYMPAEADVGKTEQRLLTSSESVLISGYKKKYTNIDITCLNKGKEGYIDVPLFYYPCYKAKSKETGETLALTYGENARIRIMLPSGYQGTISLKVGERKLWRMAEVISILSVLITVYMAVRKRNAKSYTDREQKRKPDI